MKFLVALTLLATLSSIAVGHFVILLLDGTAVSEKHVKPWSSEVNLEWLQKVKKWHIPVWSRFYQYRTASEVLGKEIEDINLNELGTRSCLVFEPPNKVSGFGQKSAFSINGTATSFDFKSNYAKAHPAKFRFSLTDNSRFLLGITQWADGERGWAVLTPDETRLDQITLSRILSYVQSVGFNCDFATWEDYTGCPA